MNTSKIIRGGDDDRRAYEWARREQGYSGTWDQWIAIPIDERQEYEVGAAGGGPAKIVVESITP